MNTLLLCLRGALTIILTFGSIIFWSWLLIPFPQDKYGSPEYWQAKDDTATALFGGFGLLVCLLFLTWIGWHLIQVSDQ